MSTPELDRRVLLGVAGLAGVAALTRVGVAGPLSPPAGPVASTGKTLTEVEPRTAINAANTPGDAANVYVISQPGSYYLTGNITVPSGKSGIYISVSNVTLDLNGFSISGNALGGGGSVQGIKGTGADTQLNVTIRNGTVQRMGDTGIFFSALRHTRIEDITAQDNGRLGVWVGGWSVLNRVICHNNGTDTSHSGMFASYASRVHHCQFTYNRGEGLACYNSTVTECVATTNGGIGISVDHGSHVSRCSSTDNTGQGFYGNVGCVIEACTSYSNAGRGIQLGNGGVITNCSVASNFNGGISTGDGSAISHCSVYSNYAFATPANGNGISVGNNSTVSHCTSLFHSNYGICAAAAATVGVVITHCTCRSNNVHGIYVGAKSRVADNQCNLNGINGFTGAGIYAAGTDNRIERNNCSDSTWGLNIDGSGNYITGNSCSGNGSNYRFGINNVFGPVVNQTGLAASGMLGNGPVASTMGSTDPYANLAF